MNYADILVATFLIAMAIIAIIIIRRNKGKCAYCKMSKTCPIKKVTKDDK